MFKIPVQFKPAPSRRQPHSATSATSATSAWMVKVRDADEILSHLVRCGANSMETKLLFVPSSGSGIEVVIISPTKIESPKDKACVPFFETFGLLLPAGTDFFPRLTKRELDNLRSEYIDLGVEHFVFVPHTGLLGFSKAETLTIADLIQRPTAIRDRWNSAESGLYLNDRFTEVAVYVLLPSLSEICNVVRDR